MPWLFTLIVKSADSLFYMNLISFISFFLISFQGISENVALRFIEYATVLSVVTVFLQILAIVISIIKKDKALKKTGKIFGVIIKTVITTVVLIIFQLIHVLSIGWA